MNNNNLDQITMQSSKRKIARFNLKHTNDTSFGIGEIQPLMCKEVIPDSNSVFSITNVVRLDPMVAPTFGDLKLHHNISFVGMSDLFPNKFKAMLAQQPTQFGLLQQVPQYIPYTKLRYLSYLCLIGSKVTIYRRNNSSSWRLYEYTWAGVDGAGATAPTMSIVGTSANDFYNTLAYGTTTPTPTDPNTLYSPTSVVAGTTDVGDKMFGGYDSNMMNLTKDMGITNRDLWIPTRNWCDGSFFKYVDTNDVHDSPLFTELCDLETISPDSMGNYDAVYQVAAGYNGHSPMYCFKFSDFGKRLYKLLLALGYGFDLNSNCRVSLSKLFACYMAWFNSFAPTLYQGWETTNCAKLLSLYDSTYTISYDLIPFEKNFSLMTSDELGISEAFFGFIRDLASMWYTEEQDFVTAHVRQNAVSPKEDLAAYMNGGGNSWNSRYTPNENGVVNVTDGANSSAEVNSVSPSYTGHAYINNVLHTQLDSEVLKRLYKVVNRNTIAGRRIKQLLQTQGLGDYAEQCKSNFIGHASCDIEIFDVTATADTLQRATGEGMYTGEYVGKGVGDSKSRKFKFKTSEFGYIIDLAAIVPESGWTNGVDLSTRNVTKLDFHHPEYEAIGLEPSPKGIITGVLPFVTSAETSSLEVNFGFIPRGTRDKITQNVLNGNFGLHSTQKTYLPYTFNKFVEVGARDCAEIPSSASDCTDFAVRDLLTADRLPIASPMYRYIGRYPWMGRFMRIFANLGRDAEVNYPTYYDDYSRQNGESLRWYFCGDSNDAFLVHNVFLYDYYAPMLPIEDSFETHEDGNNGYTDLSMGKA